MQVIEYDWLNENTWVIADTHLFHDNIIKYTNEAFKRGDSEYPGRPLNHDNLIIGNWNSMCQNEDDVLHLGDVILAKVERMRALKWVLRGNKYLIRGNHDSRGKLRKHMGFTVVKSPIIFPIAEFTLIFSHAPLWENWKQGKNPINVHGHIHNYFKEKNDHFNMCVEVRDYRPWRISEILEELRRKK